MRCSALEAVKEGRRDANHNVQVDKCPTQSTRKADIQLWLQRRSIPFTTDMLKPELLELCKLNKQACCNHVEKV